MLPENWVCLLVSVEPIDTTKPKLGRRKDSLLVESKEKQASFNFMIAVTICSDFGAPKNKACH